MDSISAVICQHSCNLDCLSSLVVLLVLKSMMWYMAAGKAFRSLFSSLGLYLYLHTDVNFKDNWSTINYQVNAVSADLVMNRAEQQWWSFHDINSSDVSGCGGLKGPMAIVVSEETPPRKLQKYRLFSLVNQRTIIILCDNCSWLIFWIYVLEGILGDTLSKFSIWGLYITFVLAVGRFIRLQCADLRMRIPYENLPSCDR